MKDKDLTHKSIEQFITEIAEPRLATPGAGSSAAVVAAIAASLVEMIGQLAEKEGYRGNHARDLVSEARRLRAEMLKLAEADHEALQKMLLADGEYLPAEALYIPQLIALLSIEICQLSAEASLLETRTAAGDATVAGYLAQSAVQAAAEIVRHNLAQLNDNSELQSILYTQAEGWEEEAQAILQSYIILH